MTAITRVLGLVTLLMISSSVFAVPTVHHELEIILKPGSGDIHVQDTITLPEEVQSFEFELHSALAVKRDTGFGLQVISKSSGSVPVTRYRLSLNSRQRMVNLQYQGTLTHEITSASSDYSSSDVWSPAIIDDEGVFLAGVSSWYPQISSYAVTFSMQVNLPEGWHVISQGKSMAGVPNSWVEHLPQEEIYLVAARYHVYERHQQGVLAQVYLREPDPALAERYLGFTHKYIELYSRLIGDYPFHKFALVENFLQTGYGMPSFTLLGSRVIRLPFIPYTSYPHEVLHNWWGNGVYVDYSTGNWAEGLTTYLADHLLKEQRGGGADYRRDAMQRYADYVSSEKDIALNQFRARHSKASQAIGYGKAMMWFHMIRLAVGDRQFIEGLRQFYRQNRFSVAGYQQLMDAFEQAGNKEIQPMFEQWLKRTGLPELEAGTTRVRRLENSYELELELKQQQDGEVFKLLVPILIQSDAASEPQRALVQMNTRKQLYRFTTPDRPVRVAIDPQYDTLRRLHHSEIPASLAQLFGADDVLIVLPSQEGQDLLNAYLQLAEQWSGSSPGIEIVMDNKLESLPQNRMVWIFGRNNRFAGGLLPTLGDRQFIVNPESLTIGDQDYDAHDHSFAVTVREHRDDNVQHRQTIGWFVAHSTESFAGLARKLPHYGKYSYVLFRGEAPTNVVKEQWQLNDSALWITLPGGENAPPLSMPGQQALSATVSP